jgi:hypothetical protein
MFLDIHEIYRDATDVSCITSLWHNKKSDSVASFSLGDWSNTFPETSCLWFMKFSLDRKTRIISPGFIHPFEQGRDEEFELWPVGRRFTGEYSWKNPLLRKWIWSTIEAIIGLEFPDYTLDFKRWPARSMSDERILQLDKYGAKHGMLASELYQKMLHTDSSHFRIVKFPSWITGPVILQSQESR